jgi:hypothetical protein
MELQPRQAVIVYSYEDSPQSPFLLSWLKLLLTFMSMQSILYNLSWAFVGAEF